MGITNVDVEIKGVRVLVVDDEIDARALLKRILEDSRAIVTAAESAEEAIELLLVNSTFLSATSACPVRVGIP